MCDDITAHARQAGFVVYPETGGWDLVLVRAGIQIGVQAKLKFTHHLVAQALDGAPWVERCRRLQVGPHYRAVACCPARSILGDARTITQACHLLFLDLNSIPLYWLYRSPCNRHHRYRWGVQTPIDWRYYRWHPNKLVWLPPGVPNLPAGVPSPSSIGPWQVAATRLEAVSNAQGWVTRADAQEAIKGVGATYNPSTMLQRYYECTIDRDPKNPKQRKWTRHPRFVPASRQFPEAWKMVQ
jgi:hypothetical protein